MVSITDAEVQEVYGEKDPGLSSGKQTALRQIAERLTEDAFGGRLTTLSEIEGDEEDFTKYLAAFLWDTAEGRSLNQEFQTGNAAPVERVKSDPTSALSGNPYGEVCLLYLRNRSNIGLITMNY
jgi:hypothetical protein